MASLDRLFVAEVSDSSTSVLPITNCIVLSPRLDHHASDLQPLFRLKIRNKEGGKESGTKPHDGILRIRLILKNYFKR